ncbi:CYTH domain-containing protein [Oceanobacillus luteolus]|uniref:CYTH domain-containing protein n=1 Tax=Oceanobacillus luteolus TaxID=1274358 RepID=A0ABW4HTK2_9BACI|nr:CYTH domain-containing protein [Oceanobacillus luteolus]MCM3741116.1 CYTH domain-containing protein [Oceanobacillus luteolus]
MAQEIEIEFKNLLTKDEFDTLLDAYPFPKEGTEQTNYYFETANLDLKELGCALRIRKKNGQYILTLKEPYGDGLLETHDHLTSEEAESWLNGKPIEKEHTLNQLKKLDVKIEGLINFGSLTTVRREYEDGTNLFVLDYSRYNDQEDYELELEVKNFDEGQKTFHALLEEHHIPKRRTPNKIERFYISLKNLDGRH